MRHFLVILILFCGKGSAAGHVSAVLTDEHRNQLSQFERKFFLTLATSPEEWKPIEKEGIVRVLIHKGQVKGYVVIQALRDHSLLKRFYVEPDFTDDKKIAQLLAHAPKGLPLVKDYKLHESHERLERTLKQANVIPKEEYPLYAPFDPGKLNIRDYENADFEDYRVANVDTSTHAAFLAATTEQRRNLKVRVIEYGKTFKGFIVEEDTYTEHRILGFSNDLPGILLDPLIESVKARTNSEQALSHFGNANWAAKLRGKGVVLSHFDWAVSLDSERQLELVSPYRDDPGNTRVSILVSEVKEFGATHQGGYSISTKDSQLVLENLRISSNNVKLVEDLIIRDLLYRSRVKGGLPVSVNYYLNDTIHFFFRNRNMVPGGVLEEQPNDWKSVTVDDSPDLRSTNLYDILGLEKGVNTPHADKPIQKATTQRIGFLARVAEQLLTHYELNGEKLPREQLEHKLNILGLSVPQEDYEKKIIADALKAEIAVVRRASAILLNPEARAAYDNDWISLKNPTKPLHVQCVKAYSELMQKDY